MHVMIHDATDAHESESYWDTLGGIYKSATTATMVELIPGVPLPATPTRRDQFFGRDE